VAGGLDWLVQGRAPDAPAPATDHHPRAAVDFLLTVCVGTGHAVYSLLPVIADVALKTDSPGAADGNFQRGIANGYHGQPGGGGGDDFPGHDGENRRPGDAGPQILMVTLPAD
jgi:anaerobic C4-dicarboxylate transporter DcuB